MRLGRIREAGHFPPTIEVVGIVTTFTVLISCHVLKCLLSGECAVLSVFADYPRLSELWPVRAVARARDCSLVMRFPLSLLYYSTPRLPVILPARPL